MTQYEICQVPTYKKTYEKSEKSLGDINEIVNLMIKDFCYHERLHKTDILKLFVDIDYLALHNPTVSLQQVFNNLCEFLNIEMDDISYTTNAAVETGSHHIVIPKYYMSSTRQKHLWSHFIKTYKCNKEIDYALCDKDIWFRLPNQTKEGKVGTKHIIKQGELKDFILKYIPDDSVEYIHSEVFETNVKVSKTKSTKIKVIIEDNVNDVDDVEEVIEEQISTGILDLNIDEIKYYIANDGFINEVKIHNSWIVLAGTFLSIMTPDNAYECWELATKKNGSINKNNEMKDHFKHMKPLIPDPIIGINSIRKQIKKEFPSIFNGWKTILKEQQEQEKKSFRETAKQKIREFKEAKDRAIEQVRENRERAKEFKDRIKEEVKEAKEEIKEAKQQAKEEERNLIEERRSNFTFVNNDNEAVDIIYSRITKDFIYTQGQMYYKIGNKWVFNEVGIYAMLLKFILEAELYKVNEPCALIAYSQNVGTAKAIREGLISKLIILNNDDKLYEKFHSTTKNKLCFKDGVLDFQTKTFTLWADIEDKTIYTTIIIERNYAEYFKNPNRTFINKIKDDIISKLFGDKTELALQFFSRAITGNIQDKNFMSYCGNRDCGKGIIYGNFKSAFGEYVTSFNLENMMCKRENNKSSDNAKENAWLIPFQYSRFAIAQETDENENNDIKQNYKISNKVMKNVVGGGDELEARGMRQNAFKFTIDTTIAFFGNNQLAISGTDSQQHHLKFSGVKQFITKELYDDYSKLGTDFISSYAIRDETLKDKVKTDDYSNAMVYLLYENYINISITVKTENDDEERVKSIRELIFNTFTITKNDKDRVAKDIVFESIKGDKKKILDELKEIGCVGDCNCKMYIEITDEKGEVSKKQVQAFKGLTLKSKISV
jgi:hypothetical protein